MVLSANKENSLYLEIGDEEINLIITREEFEELNKPIWTEF